jgi:hypothetical protein
MQFETMTSLAKLPMLFVLAWLPVTADLQAQDEDPLRIPSSLSGLSVSQADQVEDSQPLDFENELLIRLLYRVSKISQKNFLLFSQYTQELAISDVLQNSRKHRFWVFDLRGRAKHVEVHKFVDDDPDSGLKVCYIVDLVLPTGEAVKVVARAVPRAWIGNALLDQQAGFRGFYFGTINTGASSEQDAPSVQPLFVSDRIAWFPDQVAEDMGVGVSHVLLAGQGVDIGLLDEVKKQNTLPLSAADTECFFQMLSASRAIQAKEIPTASTDFVGLMQDPTKHFGDSVRVQGRVRRCVPVEIEDQEISSQLGFDRYYELDMLVPLGDQCIVVKNGPTQTLEYRDRFPVTVCLVHLNPGMTAESLRNQDLVVDGFFYRFWKYQSEFTDQEQAAGGQVSPLIIGLSPVWIVEVGPGIDRLLTFSMLGLLVGAVVLFLWMRPGNDKRGRSSTSTVHPPLPERPDFSRIEREMD